MYHIEFRRPEYQRQADQPVSGGFSTIEEAAAGRKLSGDLVIETSSGRVVTDTCWLFDWEKGDPKCFAAMAIQWQLSCAPIKENAC